MAGATIGFGLALIVLGAAAFFGGGRASITALIPAFFGLPIVLLGVLALRERWERPALIGAAFLGAVGVAGALSRIVGSLMRGEAVDWSLAVWTQLVMAAVCAALVVIVGAGLIRRNRQ